MGEKGGQDRVLKNMASNKAQDYLCTVNESENIVSKTNLEWYYQKYQKGNEMSIF